VDIGRIAGLSYIRETAGGVAIGATTTHAEVAASALLQRICPVLAEAAAHIGDAQVRNKGTLGGSLVHADPAADWPAAILALDAQMEIASPAGRRKLRATEFFVEMMQSAVQPNEILVEIRVPVTPQSVAYVKTAQKASGFAIAGVAVIVDAEALNVRVGVTGIAPRPYRAGAVEEALHGQELTAETIAAAALRADEGVETLNDIHASAQYRAHLAEVNTRRALERAAARA